MCSLRAFDYMICIMWKQKKYMCIYVLASHKIMEKSYKFSQRVVTA